MPTQNQVRLAKPKDWQEFQRLISDLFKEIWNDPYADEFGRQGQRQFGVDILGTPDNGKHYEGVQCKCISKLSSNVVRKEYEESKNFVPILSKFIIATTASRDTKVQQIAAELSNNGPYRCIVLFWQDICNKLSNYVSVLKKYYSDFYIFKMIGDSPGKIIKVDIDTTRYELLVSKLSEDDSHYGGTLLICDLLDRKCQTYRIGDHWSRLDGFIGITKFDAFVVSSFLNSIDCIDSFLKMGESYFIYEPDPQSVKHFLDVNKTE